MALSHRMGATPMTSAATAQGHTASFSKMERSARELFTGMRNFAIENALVHPEQVARAPDDAGGAENSVNRLGLECAAEHEEFSDETVQQRQARRGKDDDKVRSGIDRHSRGQAAEFADLVSVAALMQNARQA